MRRILAVVPVLWLAAAMCVLSGCAVREGERFGVDESGPGWITLFDGKSTLGWHSPNDSKWNIVDGMLAPQADTKGLLVSNTAFRDYELLIEYRVRADSKVELIVDCDADGKRSQKENKAESLNGDARVLRMPYREESEWTTMTTKVIDGKMGAFASKTRYSDIMETMAKAATKTKTPDKPIEVNHIGHIAFSGNGVVIRRIKVRPLNLKPLFNGKDLTGWKPFTGDKPKVQSTFTVTPEGLLSLKNGPGDLQTEGQWADFIFQGECRTNGPNLNSGIFFRCRPGEYQNGYEAQIHNGFGDTPKKYTVEDYDPKTHELIGKHEVESNALDYGTGAIYRRVPARLSVAKDGEWFTMTIVAEGNHIATWVDGVQVVDWTDNRPLKDNARNGCRLEKGPISLQGHDATTDLNFRKLSVADLGEKK